MRTYVDALLCCLGKGGGGCCWILTGGGSVGQCEAVVGVTAGPADVVLRVVTDITALNTTRK